MHNKLTIFTLKDHVYLNKTLSKRTYKVNVGISHPNCGKVGCAQ